MKKYDTYIDSGIEWIGEIPSIKNLLRNKYFLKYIKGKNPEKLNSEGDGIPYVGASELDNLTGMVNYENYTEQLELPQCTNSNVLVLWDGARAGLIGKNHCGAISSTVVKLEPDFNNINENYLFYYLKGFEKFLYDKVNGTTIPHMNRDYIEEIKWIDFTIDEQQIIADYLDKKCGEIDKVVEAEKSVIEKLKEYKQSIITEAVTKGLDKSVPLKDSGIEWIGKIPQHWEVSKLKHYIKSIESGVSVNASDIPIKSENDIGILKTSCVSSFKFLIEENKEVNYDEYERVCCPVRANTLIVSRMNTPELVGACGYSAIDVNNIYLPDRLWQVFIEDKIIHVKYAYYYIICTFVRDYISSLSTGTSSSMQNISQGQFSSIYIPVSSLSEQQQIAEYLDKKCSEIDKAIADKEQLIEKFTEYKKSLIYECVTGKRKVVA